MLEILKSHSAGQVRVIASGHAWSDAIVTTDTLLDLHKFDKVKVFDREGQQFVRVGAGCQIKHLIEKLNKRRLTLPSIGLITEQRIAGAISTGTHGSGKHSLSHYVVSVRVACFAEGSEEPEVRVIDEGVDLQATRCSLGCMGVITEVTLPVMPQYFVREKTTFCDSIEHALELESNSPLQQFFLMPHSWNYLSQERSISSVNQRSNSAWIYQIYWFLSIDVGMHLGLIFAARWLRRRSLVRLFFKQIIPLFLFPKWTVVDRSDRILTMEHELFRHLELELFVPRDQLTDAAGFVERILQWADGIEVNFSDDEKQQLSELGLETELTTIKGSYTHHYPICYRKILADETLISMAAGQQDAWYAISLITYVEPRDDFFRVATFLAKFIVSQFGGRIHWGKWFPLDRADVEKMYPRIEEFREVCDRYDPQGVFRNEFVKRTIFNESKERSSQTEPDR